MREHGCRGLVLGEGKRDAGASLSSGRCRGWTWGPVVTRPRHGRSRALAATLDVAETEAAAVVVVLDMGVAVS